MDLSPLSKAIPSWGAPTLEGFDLDSVQEGQRIKGSGRQYVRFYNKTYSETYAKEVKINEKTGSCQVLKTDTRPVTKEFVQIITPGDKNEYDGVAYDYHRREHWKAYKAFRDGRTAPLGLSVDEVDFISPGVATELRYYNCHTVEQLADCSDELCNQIPNGWELREFAKEKVKAETANKSSADVIILKSELEKSKDIIAQMGARLAQLESRSKLVGEPLIAEPAKVKRQGRPRKPLTETTETVTE